jgi:curved DNA-binding protein CbpA
MEGVIGPGIVPALLREIYVHRRSGVLHFTRGSDRYALWFQGGHLVFGSSAARELWLGEVLLSRGYVLPDELEKADAQVGLMGRRLGQVLVEMGLLSRDGVKEALAIHAGLIVQRVLAWTDGRHHFEEMGEEPPDDDALHVPTGQVILEAARGVEDELAIRRALEPRDRVLLPASDVRLRFQRLTLSQVEAFVLSRIDGTLSVRELQDVVPLPADVVDQSVFALLCTGLVEAAQPAPAQRSTSQFLRQEILDLHARLSAVSHYDALGVPPHASDAEIKAAFLRLAKRYHPDVHHEPALADLRDALEALFLRVTQAWQVLSNPITRRAYDGHAVAEPAGEPRTPFPPDDVLPSPPELFARAEQCLSDGRVDEAVVLLQQTTELAGGGLRHRARLALARQFLKRPDWVRNAERELQGVIGEDPEHIEAHLLLADLYARQGLGRRAEALLRRVLARKPGHAQAAAALAALPAAGA